MALLLFVLKRSCLISLLFFSPFCEQSPPSVGSGVTVLRHRYVCLNAGKPNSSSSWTETQGRHERPGAFSQLGASHTAELQIHSKHPSTERFLLKITCMQQKPMIRRGLSDLRVTFHHFFKLKNLERSRFIFSIL